MLCTKKEGKKRPDFAETLYLFFDTLNDERWLGKLLKKKKKES